MRNFWMILLSGMVVSCSTGPQSSSINIATADFTQLKDSSLCAIYGERLSRADEARAELLRRGTLTISEVAVLDVHQLQAGMSECAVLAAYGTPPNTLTSDSASKVKEYVYACSGRKVPYCPATSILLQNGKVAQVRPAKL